MALTVEIGSLTFAIQPHVVPTTEYEHRADGLIYARTETWSLHGFFKGDESTVKANRDTIRAQIELGIQDVVIKKDGVNHITLLQADLFRSPRFINYREVGNPGLFFNHIEFFVDLIAKKSIEVAGIERPDFRQETKETDQGTDIGTTVSATGPQAEAYVRSLEPAGTSERRIVEDRINDRWIATYLTKGSSTTGGGGIAGRKMTVDETIRVSGGLFPKQYYPRTGNLPFRIDGADAPATVSISGTIRAFVEQKATIQGNLFNGFRQLNGLFIRDNAISFEDSGIEVEDWKKPGDPRTFRRSYSVTFIIEQRIDADSFTQRFTVAEIVR